MVINNILSTVGCCFYYYGTYLDSDPTTFYYYVISYCLLSIFCYYVLVTYLTSNISTIYYLCGTVTFYYFTTCLLTLTSLSLEYTTCDDDC